MSEKWVDIKGYEKEYQISDMGRVRSLDRIVKNRWGGEHFRHGAVMSLHLDCFENKMVSLTKDNKQKRFGVERLRKLHFDTEYI